MKVHSLFTMSYRPYINQITPPRFHFTVPPVVGLRCSNNQRSGIACGTVAYVYCSSEPPDGLYSVSCMCAVNLQMVSTQTVCVCEPPDGLYSNCVCEPPDGQTGNCAREPPDGLYSNCV